MNQRQNAQSEVCLMKNCRENLELKQVFLHAIMSDTDLITPFTETRIKI